MALRVRALSASVTLMLAMVIGLAVAASTWTGVAAAAEGGPQIGSLEVPSAFPRQFLNVYGSGFTGTSQVLVAGRSVAFSVITDGDVVIRVPADFTGGDITVITPSGSSSYPLRLFSVSSVSPSAASVGNTITISGTGLGQVRYAYFQATDNSPRSAQVQQLSVVNDNQITLVVPPGTPAQSTIVLSQDNQFFFVNGTFNLAKRSPHRFAGDFRGGSRAVGGCPRQRAQGCDAGVGGWHSGDVHRQ